MRTDLIETTIGRLQAFEPKEGYYGAFSGGKDSQVLYELVKMSGVKCDWHFQKTSVDPPQVLSFMRQHYPDVHWHKPEKTMFQLILKNKMLPTRLARFCCRELKERGGEGQVVLAGVRAEESNKRSTYQMVTFCQKTHKHLVYPLLDWKWSDVWTFLYEQNLPHCELYDPPYNFKRIGCIGCPMGNTRTMNKEFRFFPKFKKAYLNTIQKVMDQGGFLDHSSPESVLRWWISGVNKHTFFEQERQEVFCFDN